jgi:transcriptional regulator with XRE-family HTH domain
MGFGEKLQALRERAKLTQAELAARAGVSRRNVEAWEVGRRIPRTDAFFKLMAALGVDCRVFAACWTALKQRR